MMTTREKGLKLRNKIYLCGVDHVYLLVAEKFMNCDQITLLDKLDFI